MKDFGELVTCKMGHHYYPGVTGECLECKKASKEGNRNRYLFETSRDADVEEQEEMTVAVVQKKMGYRPVAGWLVCIEGAMKGQDYRFYAENNFIGRDASNDICLSKDESVSREKHSIISFDSRSGKYYYTPGTGRNLDSVNNQTIFGTVELKNKDVLEIGKTKMVVVTLCNESFQWENWEEVNE